MQSSIQQSRIPIRCHRERVIRGLNDDDPPPERRLFCSVLSSLLRRGQLVLLDHHRQDLDGQRRRILVQRHLKHPRPDHRFVQRFQLLHGLPFGPLLKRKTMAQIKGLDNAKQSKTNPDRGQTQDRIIEIRKRGDLRACGMGLVPKKGSSWMFIVDPKQCKQKGRKGRKKSNRPSFCSFVLCCRILHPDRKVLQQHCTASASVFLSLLNAARLPVPPLTGTITTTTTTETPRQALRT